MEPDKTEKVCSFFYLGTDHHRENTKGKYNLINQFGKAAVVDDNHFKRVFDGPGSVAKNKLLRDKHPTPGNYTVDFVSDTKIPKITTKANPFKKAWQKINIARGLLFGKGVEDNIIESLQYLDYLDSQGNLPDKINLYGFSRGGDTSIVLANILYSIYPNIEVNICVVDPVPGGADIRRNQSSVITPNVNQFTSILMLNENTPMFTPSDQEHIVISDPYKTKVNYQTYHGNHGFATRGGDDPTLQAAPILAHDTFYKFTREHGTNLKNDAMPLRGYSTEKGEKEQIFQKEHEYPNGMTNVDRLVEYEKMKSNKGEYNHKGLPDRHILVSHKKGRYVRDPDFFMNQEHRELFAEEFPAVFNYFFKNNMLGNIYSKNQVLFELDLLNNGPDMNGWYFNELQRKFGIVFENDDYILPPPSGNENLEVFPITTGLPVCSDEESYMRQAVISLINQFEVSMDLEHTFKGVRHKNLITKLTTNVTDKLHAALDQYENSDEPYKVRHNKLHDALYDVYKTMQRNKKIDILEINDSMMINQIKNMIGSTIISHECNANISQLLGQDHTKGLFFNKKSAPTIPGSTLEIIGNYSRKVTLFQENSNLSELEKIKLMRDISRDTRNALVENIKNNKHSLHKKDIKNIKIFIKNIDKQLQQSSYANQIANDFNKAYKKHQFFSKVYKYAGFTKFGKIRRKHHVKLAKAAKLARDRCFVLEKSGKGNNHVELLKVIHDAAETNQIKRGNIISEDFSDLVNKHKDSLSVMRQEIKNDNTLRS